MTGRTGAATTETDPLVGAAPTLGRRNLRERGVASLVGTDANGARLVRRERNGGPGAARNDALQLNIKSQVAGKIPVEIRYFTSGITWAADFPCFSAIFFNAGLWLLSIFSAIWYACVMNFRT